MAFAVERASRREPFSSHVRRFAKRQLDWISSRANDLTLASYSQALERIPCVECRDVKPSGT